MNQPVNGTEERLREALRREAGHADQLAGTGFDTVRRQARGIRRRRRTVVAGLAAAAVVVVTVPTALLLQGDPDASPPPADQATQLPAPTPSPSRTPDATPSKGTGPLALSAIDAGRAPAVAYLQGHTFVDGDGTRTDLPGRRPVSAFTSYHGGWLVVDADDGHLYQYDNQGRETDLGRNGMLAVTGDGGPTALEAGGTTRMGISTGMGEGEQQVPLPKDAGIVGFLGADLVYSTPSYETWVHPATGGPDRRLPALIGAAATSTTAHLVGGQVATGSAGDGVLGAVVDARTGATLWKNTWRPLSFSPDGTYVAAVPAGDNGDAEYLAILDARTGRLVQRMALLDRKLHLAGLPPVIAWEDGDTVLFDVADASGREAILRLAVDGTLTRATDPVPTIDARPAYLFPVQP
jgi:hypothetical protein